MGIHVEEFARNGSNNGEIYNTSDNHLPIVILADTSSSIRKEQVQLEQGLAAVKEALSEEARGVVDICVITFDDHARIVSPFQSAYDFVPPVLDCGGMTAMHEAVALGLQQLEVRKHQYDEQGVPRFRSWMMLLTDGGSNDADNGAFEELVRSQREGHTIFYGVAIGEDADRALLASLHQEGVVLTAAKEDFVGAFKWLGKSASVASSSKPGQLCTLEDPHAYKMNVCL